MKSKSEKGAKQDQEKKHTTYISRTYPSPRVEMKAKEYMDSGMPRTEAYSKARWDVQYEIFKSMKEHEEQNKSGCLVALLIIIAPTILLSLLIF